MIYYAGIQMVKFDYKLDFKHEDFRAHPELYRIGKGEQGVLLVEPYKNEILPHWRFKTPEIARVSASGPVREMTRSKFRAEGSIAPFCGYRVCGTTLNITVSVGGRE